MTIRLMTINDYKMVYDLWMNTPGMGLNNIDDSEAGIEKYLKRNPNSCFVAETNNEIIGVILSGHDGRRGLIYHLAVKATAREQGIGSSLLEHALNALRNEGITKVYIIVFKHNESGNLFWEKRGFVAPDETLYRAKEIIPLEHMEIK